jgi:hypothetical protein
LKELTKQKNMETHKIDSIIKKVIRESENFYDSEATNAKERIWHHVQLKKQNQAKPLVFRLLVAASILLFIGLSILTISNIKNRNTINTLVELNSALREETAIINRKSLLNEPLAANNAKIHDTIYIEKKVVEYRPIVTTKQITDTVYIQQIVYVEKEPQPASLEVDENRRPVDSVSHTIGNNYKSEITIRNSESTKREKGNKIQLKFGSNSDQTNRGTLAFTTEL